MLVRCDVLLYRSLEYAVLAVQAEGGSYTMSGEPSVSSASIACRCRTVDRDVDQGDRRAPEGRGESCERRRIQFVVAEDWQRQAAHGRDEGRPFGVGTGAPVAIVRRPGRARGAAVLAAGSPPAASRKTLTQCEKAGGQSA